MSCTPVLLHEVIAQHLRADLQVGRQGALRPGADHGDRKAAALAIATLLGPDLHPDTVDESNISSALMNPLSSGLEAQFTGHNGPALDALLVG